MVSEIRTKLAKPLVVATALALAGSGCHFFESVTATTIVSGLMVATPGVTFKDFVSLESETVATIWVGERESATSTEAPTPISNANVSVGFSGGNVPLEAVQGSGVYTKSSIDSALDYIEASVYDYNAVVDGETFGGKITTPPKLQRQNVTYSPAPSTHPVFPNELAIHPKSTDLTISWNPNSGRFAYVSVFRADKATPDMPEFVYDTRPETAEEILEFVVGTPPPMVTIPADIFAVDGLYGVVLFTMDNGDPLQNTFIGSPILAGSGAVQLFVVGDVDVGT